MLEKDPLAAPTSGLEEVSNRISEYLPPENFDPFEFIRAKEQERNAPIDYSNIEDIYGSLGLGDYTSAFVGGTVDAVAATAEGAASLYGVVSGDHRLAKSMSRYRDHMEDSLTGHIPDELKKSFSYKAVNAIGQMPAYIAMGYGSAGTSLALRGLSYASLGTNAYQQGRDDYISSIGAKGRDLTEEETKEANRVGGMTAIPLFILERVGATTLVNAMFRGTGGKLTVGNAVKRLAKAPLAEAGTEGSQTLLQNFVASELASYDPDRPVTAGVVESMILGAIASGTYSTPAVGLQIQAERLAENIDSGNVNADEMVDELGQKLFGAAIDAGSIPATGADESKILHTRGAVTKFIDDVLSPLTTTLSKAGPQYKRAFRDFERRTGVQTGRAKKIITPFIRKVEKLKKLSKEDYETLQDALANVGIVNKDNQTELDDIDSPQADEEVSTAELKENDEFFVDESLPVGFTSDETVVINGVKVQRKTRGPTEDEAQGGIRTQEVEQKINVINQQAKNAERALSNVVPDLGINVYASPKEFQEATGVDGDSVAGFYDKGRIYINATLAKFNTVAHEAFHAVFLSKSPTSKEAQNASLDLINTIARSSSNENLVQYAKRFSEQYNPDLQNEEALAEMFGVLSSNYATLDVSTKTQVKVWLAKVADMLGISGLFSEATTDKEIIDAFNTLSSSVANGTVTPEGIRISRGSGTIGSEGTESQRRFQADYTDPDTGVTYSYFKNSSQYQKMVNDGFITNDRSFFDFDGVPMSIHVPDAMFTGEISMDGEQIIEGRGGLNATARFHDDNGFWLSTKSAAEGMARDLNAQLNLPESDGKVRMMLTSTNTKKILSSVDGARATVKIMSRMSNYVPDQYKEQADKVFMDALKESAKLKNKKGDGLKLGKLLDGSLTVNQAELILNEYLNESKQSFSDRSAFVEFLFNSISDRVQVVKKDEKSYKDIDFRRAYLDALHSVVFKSSKMVTQSDLYTMGSKKKLPQSNLSVQMKDAVSYMMAEPLIRDYNIKSKDFGSVVNGSAYAIIEIDGPVKAVEFLNEDGSQKHESYRFAIVSDGNKKATTHLLKDRVRALSHYDLGGKTENQFLMTQAGFTQSDYGIRMINKDKARKIKGSEVMEPMTGRGSKLKFPVGKTQRFQIAERGYKRSRSPEIESAAAPVFEKLSNKEMVTKEESRNLAETASRVFPVKKYDSIPTPATKADLIRGLNSRQERLINLGRDFEDGRMVKLRLDINAYTKQNVWAPTIHDGSKNPNDFNGGTPISHQSTAVVTSARFGVGNIATGSGQKSASGIASGKNKIPVATVIGSYKNLSEAESMQRAEAALEDPSYIQVGMDPERRGYFYNRETMKEVVAADEVIQVGPLLMAKNPKYGRTPPNEYISYETDADIIDVRMQKLENETHEQALDRIIQKYNMDKEFKSVRKLLNYLYKEGREAGMDVSYMEQYFPRLVTDLAGLQSSWEGVLYGNEVERDLDNYAKKKFNGRSLDPIERQIFLENLARNKINRSRAGGSRPKNTLNRNIPVIDSDRRSKYYATAEVALDNYVDSMISSINQMKLIGTARLEKGQRVRTGLISKMMDEDLKRGTLSNEAINIIQDAIEARFGMNGQQSGIIRGAKNAGYIATMGNIGSAITQLGDFYFSAVQNGTVNTIQSALARKELSREDILGMKDLVTVEAKEGAKSLQKAVDFVFKASGITAIDGLAKDTNINAALRDMRKRARGKPNSRPYQKLYKELSSYQGRQAAQTIADIRNGVNSDLVLEAIYNRLSNVAPISLSEMPAAYSGNPNARIIYSLKSYTIKQFDFIRQESFSKMGSSKTFAEGFTNLLRIATLAMAANGTADVLKAILFNREIDEEDLVWNNILRMFGITKYTTTKARKEGLGTAFINTILPPQVGILNDFSKDIGKSIEKGQLDIDELRSVKYLPFVGKLYYWREGKGVDVEKRLSNLKD